MAARDRTCIESLVFDSANVRARLHVIGGVAKGVAKVLRLHTVQGVRLLIGNLLDLMDRGEGKSQLRVEVRCLLRISSSPLVKQGRLKFFLADS